MFGYIVCSRESLAKEELDRYQEMYCGLCRVLRKSYGQLAGLALNYDMTFLALFLSSLYEPEEERGEFRCPGHPLHRKRYAASRFTEYAAAMTVALSYYKCADDWKDERKYTGKVYGGLLKKSYAKVRAQYPRQCGAIAESLARLDEVERDPDAPVDEAVNCSGRMLAELFVYREDFWSGSLRQFGYELGRFIYLMDAAVDYEKDKKTGNYNPLHKMGRTPAQAEEFLDIMMGNAAAIFEKLPMIQDERLLENIIYAGVWQRYNRARAEDAKRAQEEKTPETARGRRVRSKKTEPGENGREKGEPHG